MGMNGFKEDSKKLIRGEAGGICSPGLPIPVAAWHTSAIPTNSLEHIFRV